MADGRPALAISRDWLGRRAPRRVRQPPHDVRPYRAALRRPDPALAPEPPPHQGAGVGRRITPERAPADGGGRAAEHR